LWLIYGKKDKFVSDSFVKGMEEVLKIKYPDKPYVVIFRTLGHFLGSLVDQEGTARYYSIDNEVLQTIQGWITSIINKPIETKAEPVVEKTEVLPSDDPVELTNT